MIHIKHYGDITKISGYDVPPANVVIGGSPCQDLSVAGKRAGLAGKRSGLFMEQIRVIKEMREADEKRGRTGDQIRPRFMVWENVCFTGDTLISTVNGFKRIDEVEVGDLVLTNSGSYMPVCATHVTESQKCISVRAQGSTPVICTGNHPFLAVKIKKDHRGCISGYTDPEYIRADELTKDNMLLTRIDREYTSGDFISDADAWAVGRWMADGSVDLNRSNPRIFISCGDYKLEYAEKMLSGLAENIYKNKPHKTATNFVFTSERFYNLISTCGVGAANKRFPMYAFRLPLSKQSIMLDGYLSGDGYERSRRNGSIEISATTVSRELAYGVARLIRNVYGVPVSITTTNGSVGSIEGREIHPRHTAYSVYATVSERNRKNKIGDNYIMHRVKSVDPVAEEHDVYNLSVLEDNTYVANGFVVHNCGALSVNDGRDFAAVLEETIRVAEPEAPDIYVPGDGWTLSGAYVGRGFSVAWRVLDAQFWGVPQRRRRIALIADFAGECAPKVLFERNSLQRHLKQSETEREGSAGNAEDRSGESSAVGFDGYNGAITGGSASTLGVNCGMTTGRTGVITTDDIPSGLLNQGDVQSKHIYSEDSVCGTLCSGTTEGMNIAPSVMCLNPEDPQSERVYDESGVWHSLNANSGGGQSRDAVMTSFGVVSKGNGDAFISEERHTALSTGGGEAGQGYPCAMQPIAFMQNQRDEVNDLQDVAGCLASETGSHQQTFVAQPEEPIVLESNQNHATITDSGVSPTLSASMGLGGGYVPMITQPTICVDQGANKGQVGISEEIAPTLTTTHGGTPAITDTIAIEGNGSRESHKGNGYSESDQMYTLNTVEQHSVCYGISSYDSNAMKSDNPNSGIYKADTARTLDLNGGNPACNQGGIAIVQSAGFLPGQGAKAEGVGYADEQSPTLRASQEVGVVYPDVARSLTARNDGSPCIDRGPDFVVQERTECSGLTNRGFESGDIAETLRAESHGAIPMVVQDESSVFENHSQDSRFRGPLDVAQPVTATYGMGGNNQPLVVSDEPVAFAQQAFGEYKESDAASTVKSCDCKHETDLICNPAESESKFWDGTDVASTLTSNGAAGNQRMPDKQNFNAVIQPESFAVDVRNGAENPDVNGTLQAKSNGGTSLNLNNIVRQKYIVRRLTVLECTRLQGFPDDWLDIGDWYDENGKLHKDSDSAKYRALGNSIAIPPWLFVLGELNEYCEDKGMASLFDGVGGFPLIWSYLNGKENCVFCSEIEPFCIAVTKKRFPDGDEVDDKD